MKIPDTITAKVSEFREKFVRDDGLMDKYHGDETTADAIETFLEQALLGVRRETDATARLECSEILHKIIMDSKDLNVIDALEKAQKEILESLPNTPTV